MVELGFQAICDLIGTDPDLAVTTQLCNVACFFSFLLRKRLGQIPVLNTLAYLLLFFMFVEFVEIISSRKVGKFPIRRLNSQITLLETAIDH